MVNRVFTNSKPRNKARNLNLKKFQTEAVKCEQNSTIIQVKRNSATTMSNMVHRGTTRSRSINFGLL